MSDEDRKMKANATEDAEESTEDVEAHRHANVSGEAAADETGDDVEAHVRGDRGANDDGGDDVEAHVKGAR
jgi:hypothetical protein